MVGIYTRDPGRCEVRRAGRGGSFDSRVRPRDAAAMARTPIRFLVVCSLVLAAVAPAQNSTRKIRSAPSSLAARVGNAVPFGDDVAAALQAAKAAGKPVFWYVPTVPGSPMDRQAEVDRYLRGGPFSWPSTIALLQQHFVVVAAVPDRAAQDRYDLKRQRFIEPGYLVLDGDGGVRLRVDQLTTLHPEWFEAPLRRLAKVPADGFPGHPALREAWAAYRAGERAAARERAEAVLAAGPAAAVAAEAHWLVGAALCRDQRRRDAVQRWQLLAELLPDEPLAWKAALEAEGHGPFARGFEDYLPLPAAVLAADPVDGSRAGGRYGEAELWARGTTFLLGLDDGDGVVRDSIYDFGGTDSLPNVHAAVTCLVGQALLQAEARVQRGEVALPDGERVRLAATLDRIRANASDDAWLAASDRDEIVWARAYAVQFLVAWQRHRAGDAERVAAPLQRAVAALFALQPETGVWFHEYGNPFAIATALQALHAAKGAGVAIDQERIDRGLRALAHNRTAAGAFTYSHTRRGEPRASVEAAAGRMPLCELALLVWGAADQPRLLAAVEAGHRHHGLLAAVRKYDDHADAHGYGGFFFWYDMLGRADATMALTAADDRTRLAAAQRSLVLDLPEIDGAFVDSHELGRAYGTAMALLCLQSLAGG
jgi:hypothetical protein